MKTRISAAGFDVGVVENFKVLSEEELLIRNTEQRMIHGPIPELTPEGAALVQSMHASGFLSTKALLAAFGLDGADAPPKNVVFTADPQQEHVDTGEQP